MPAALVAAVAPQLISSLAKQGLELLSGFFNTAANAGVTRVARVMQEKTGIRVEDIADNKLTDAQWAQLKEFELRNQELLLQELETTGTLEISRLQLANADRKGARDTQEEASRSKDWLTRHFIHIYAILLTVLAFAFIMLACFYTGLYDGANGVMDAESQQRAGTVDTVLGFLLGVSLSAVIQFFFGSSHGSGEKSDTIARILNKSVPEEAAPAGGN